MKRLPPPCSVLTRCTSRGSNPDQRILSPPLSPLKVLVRDGRRVSDFTTCRTFRFCVIEPVAAP
jgi:hypothetical protein